MIITIIVYITIIDYYYILIIISDEALHCTVNASYNSSCYLKNTQPESYLLRFPRQSH